MMCNRSRISHEHFSILCQAITEAGGTEVKDLGDGLTGLGSVLA
jgi:hypothetical protein